MIRISALNDHESGDSDDSSDDILSVTKEAQESEAYTVYNQALNLQIEGDFDKAEETFEDLLEQDFLLEANRIVDEEGDNPVHPGLQMLYSTYKNLAAMAHRRNDTHRAIQYFLKAVTIDETEVTVWYKIGLIALEIHNYQLAAYSFQQGLNCNKNHWPCMDHLITSLYVLNDYWTCLKYIGSALEKDAEYMKAISFRDQIFSEQPSLRMESKMFFANCDPLVLMTHADKEEKNEYINEALEMRKIRRELAYVPPPSPLTLPKPILEYSWKCVGECLLALYDEIVHSEPRKSMGLHIDLTPYVKTPKPANDKNVVEAHESKVHSPSSNQEAQMTSDAGEGAAVAPSSEVAETAGNSGTSSSPTVQMSSPNPSATNHTPEVTTAMEVDEAGSRKVQKRKRNTAVEEVACKRRSARVRNTTRKKQEENVDLEDLLLKFLPSSLLEAREEDESKAKEQSSPQGVSSAAGSSESSTPLVFETEEQLVKKFLEDCLENGGIIDLMGTYLVQLADVGHLKWSDELVDIFLKVYSAVRKHLKLPSYLCPEEPEDYVLEMGKMVLVWAELKLDQWLMKKAKIKAPMNSSNKYVYFHHLLITTSELYIPILIGGIRLCCIKNICISISFLQPAFWLKARFCTLLGEIDEAFDYFDKVLQYLAYAEENISLSRVHLPNCHMDEIISAEKVKKQQDLLKRCQSLEKTQKLYECEEYAEVVDLLKLTFSDPVDKPKRNVLVTTSAELLEAGIAIPDRRAQLQLMMDSLSKLNNPQKYVLWGEVVFNESLQMYRESNSHTVKDDWIAFMIQLFAGMDEAILNEPSSIKELTPACTLRIAKNLIRVISDSVDVPEYATDMPIPTVLPWKLLYHIIRNEESKLHSTQAANKSESEILDNSLSSSLMLLNVAHDYLGRHSWCTRSDGELLVFFMSVIKEERAHYPEDAKHAFKDELDQAFEQCIYCLYGHPTKKGKSKYLQDHNALQINLNWEMSQVLFDYFKPKTVPEFDSYKTSTVSGELENLARRITLLVPKEKNPANTYESVLAYIEGQHNDPPFIPPDKPVTTAIVKELFYLLADYYFKNKEQVKAIKFYMLDICVNPNRLDSWAGMSLARMSRLEQKLNSTELRMDQAIYKQAIASLRCFTRAVEIDSNNAKLWIEYGSLAYQLHSHAARQLKLMHWFPLNDEMYQIATASNKEMLLIAANCYKKASECEMEGGHSEEWLYYYMMGKVCEKMRKPAHEYLEHYKEAAHHLHEDFAAYPKKINYVVSPPHLAVESLELFYRQHVAILKELLFKSAEELDLDYFEQYMIEVANGPFANQREKRHQRRENKDSNTSNEEGSCQTQSLSNNTNSTPRGATNSGTCPSSSGSSTVSTNVGAVTTSTTSSRSNQDHNYFRQKSNDSSSLSALSDELGNTSNKVKMVESLPTKTSPKISQAKSDCKSTLSSVAPKEVAAVKDLDLPPRLSKVDLSQPIFGLEDQFTTTIGEDYLDAAIDTDAMTSQALDSLNALLEAENFDKPNDPLRIDFDSVGHPEGGEQQSKELSDVCQNNSNKLASSGAELPHNVSSENSSVNINSKHSDVSKQETGKSLCSGDDHSEAGTKTGTETSSANNSDHGHVDDKKSKTEKHKKLLNMVISALHICLTRFPTHYKALYRLAHLHFYSPFNKNINYTRDILLGVPSWTQHDHLPAPGLFTDRKHSNFFQLKLSNFRKYLRDAERVCLSQLAYEYALDTVELQLEDVLESDSERQIKFLLEVYKIWCHGVNKVYLHVERTNDIFLDVFRVIMKNAVGIIDIITFF
ncbi:calcineurin-binding protein cabin-1 [Octopus bimaculoides]|nr:calcineurin-binding protein cabin-1 [Octopus bimaculoides]